uniref:Aminotransferase class I/classII large domain-containing protein n=1 Tax=Aegilops tauschii subsp. strangulata TaxID=200361 RepID=A0A453QLJ3_AEGTS
MQWLGYSEIEGRIDCNNAEGVITVIEAPRQSDLLIELVRKLKPQVVVTSITQFEAITSAAFSDILSATEDVGCRLFLDISENLEWSCLPSSNGVLKYLVGNTLPSHAAILWGLVKNQVYSDLEVAFAISEDASVCKALSQTIELLEGNTSLISQQYYGSLFHELLAFQIGDRHQHAHQVRQAAEKIPEKMIQFSNSAMSTLKEAEFFTPDSKDSSVIHMDLDRSFLPVPSPLGASILESFARRNIMDFETDVRSSIEQLVGDNYGFPGDSCPDVTFNNRSCGFSKEIIYGRLAAPTLFNKLVLCCMREQGAFLFPMGTNGHYVSAAKFMNAKTLTIPTNVGSGFKIEPTALRAALDDACENENVHWPWVYISGPTVNPSGSLYSDEEIKDLLSVCAEHGARVVIDTSFSGLEFQTGDGCSLWNLDRFSYNIASCLALRVFMLRELSLQLTMSGFDFGFMIYIDPSLIKHMLTSLSQPHRTLKYTFRKLLCLKNKRDQRFSDLIKEQKETLKHRADKLTKSRDGRFVVQRQRIKIGSSEKSYTLESCGWDVVGCHGGISMLAKPMAYIGKSFKIDTFEGELDGCNIREALLRSTGLCISSSKWTGIPDYCRFSFALESSEFDQAMDCITRFRELVLREYVQMNV